MNLQQRCFHLNKLQNDKASIEVNVDELLIVLGTSQSNMSTEDDFDWDKDPANSYISIEDQRRVIPKKKVEQKKEESKGSKSLPSDTATSEPSSIKMALEMFLNLVSVNVNKIHIRFEDDFYSHQEGPYAFGLTMNSLNINSTNKEIQFRSPLDLNYEEVTPENNKNLFLKHILLQDISVYWNSNEEVYIPYTTVERTNKMSQKIFEHNHLEPEEFRILMIQPFKDVKQYMKDGRLSRTINKDVKFDYLINPFSVDINISYYRLEDKDVRDHPHPRFQLTALVSTIALVVKPHILSDIRQFMEYFQFQMMLPYLKRFKPRRRPLTTHLYSKDPSIRRVRRMIVRDWFAYIIWSNRLKKVLKNNVCPELFEEELEVNRHKYDKALERLRNPRDNELLDRHLKLDRGYNYAHINEMVAPIIDEIHERKKTDQAKVSNEFFKKFLQKFVIVLKVQSVAIELYENSRKLTYNARRMPTLQVIIGRIRVGIKIDNCKLNLQVMLEDIKILDTLLLKSQTQSDVGRSTINDTFAVKSGFFLDEDVGDFFKRHQDDNSIFQNPEFTMAGAPRGEIGGKEILLNDNPRKHHYDSIGMEKDFNNYTSRYKSPDDIIDFGGKMKDKEFQQQEQSRFNFEGFWKKKIGSLIGLGGGDEEKKGPTRKAESKRVSLENHHRGYQDDDGRNILERCCILGEGHPVFLDLVFSVNLFTEKKDKTAINLNLTLRNFRIEYSNDLIKNLAETLLAYRGASALGDIAIASNPGLFERKIELWTPWYVIKQAFFLPEFDPHGVRATVSTFKYIEEEVKKRNEVNAPKKMKSTQRAIAGLDKSLQQLDIKMKVVIEGLYLSLNTNYNHKRYQQNRNLFQIKTDPFEIILIKHGQKFGLSVLGVQMMTQSSFELIFQFVLQMQKALSIYLDNPALKDGKKFYEDIVHNRITEGIRKTNLNNTTMSGFGGSTIRKTGGGFSFSTAPRLSTIGSFKNRPDMSSSAMGSRKSYAVEPPRNKQTINFDTIRNIQRPVNTNYNSSPKMSLHQSEPKRGYQIQEEEFEEDLTFNDTDEDISGDKNRVIESADKGTKKASLKKNASFGPSDRQYEIERQKQVGRKNYTEVVESSNQPRTGPSRLLKRNNQEIRRYKSSEEPLQEIPYNYGHEEDRRRRINNEPFEYDRY